MAKCSFVLSLQCLCRKHSIRYHRRPFNSEPLHNAIKKCMMIDACKVYSNSCRHAQPSLTGKSIIAVSAIPRSARVLSFAVSTCGGMIVLRVNRSGTSKPSGKFSGRNPQQSAQV
eukprot:gnl/TRDRNA2_/TRDRNA2_167052_c5_seq1.p1 gnl/TRDRNA2_/TRDRNA2_167052_c5~~gnl/TRDRNA2_/TRDRNA2_167052_c5_seq1.p1  ORF type:complete len:115 (-),score=1.48 gnl/TRDRNA2_/TRDRNA2_167052_c5_seq1:234-578(-)